MFSESTKPPLYRYILAHTAGISGGIGALGMLAFVLVSIQSQGVLIPPAGVLIWVLLIAVAAGAVGWIVGTIFLWGFILSYIAARLQGWPFVEGDRVCILSGKHKNTVTTVYKVWAERGQVRVKLGPELAKNVEDVYCAVAVCRARYAGQVDSDVGDATHTDANV